MECRKFLSHGYVLAVLDYALSSKAPAKRSQHADKKYRNTVGRNMLRAFGHRVTMCCNMLGAVGSSLKLVKFEPLIPNMSQHGGQTHATCSAQQCCDILFWHVAIVWSGLKMDFCDLHDRLTSVLQTVGKRQRSLLLT